MSDSHVEHLSELSDSSDESDRDDESRISERKKEFEAAGPAEKCDLCGSPEVNVYEYGEKLKASKAGKTAVAHHFCLLFSCNLLAKGRATEGIMGFLVKDILREKSRGQRLTCMFCGKKGATAACILPECKSSYHLTCAKKYEGAQPLFQFVEPYKSFCKVYTKFNKADHRPHRKNLGIDKICQDHSQVLCSVCSEEVTNIEICSNHLVVQCHHENCWSYAHTACLRRYARHAGESHFKCPACQCHPKLPGDEEHTNERQKCQQQFIEQCRLFGVYIPQKDADWEGRANHFVDSELDYNFTDHYRDYAECDRRKCLCKDGRTFDVTPDEKESPWFIVLCSSCGASAIHRECGNVAVEDIAKWKCFECSPFFPDDPHSDVNFREKKTHRQVKETSTMLPNKKQRLD